MSGYLALFRGPIIRDGVWRRVVGEAGIAAGDSWPQWGQRPVERKRSPASRQAVEQVPPEGRYSIPLEKCA